MQTPKIQFTFDRTRHIEPCQFSGLLQAFDADVMTPIGLRQYYGTLQILFHGYAGEPRLPFVIPELRSFLQQLRRAWPFAPWFCDLGNSFISLECMAHVDNFTVVERAESDELQFHMKTAELQRYVGESQRLIQRVGRKAGMTATEIKRRQRELAEYIRQRLGPAA